MKCPCVCMCVCMCPIYMSCVNRSTVHHYKLCIVVQYICTWIYIYKLICLWVFPGYMSCPFLMRGRSWMDVGLSGVRKWSLEFLIPYYSVFCQWLILCVMFCLPPYTKGDNNNMSRGTKWKWKIRSIFRESSTSRFGLVIHLRI